MGKNYLQKKNLFVCESFARKGSKLSKLVKYLIIQRGSSGNMMVKHWQNRAPFCSISVRFRYGFESCEAARVVPGEGVASSRGVASNRRGLALLGRVSAYWCPSYRPSRGRLPREFSSSVPFALSKTCRMLKRLLTWDFCDANIY